LSKIYACLDKLSTSISNTLLNFKSENRKNTQENKFTKNDIINDLENIGVSKGDHLAVALSFKSIGYLEGGPDAFIDALIETTDPNGTIMVPTFTRHFCIHKNKSINVDFVFDYRSTPTYTGLVPEILRRRKGVVRSRHPINSVTAIGKLADYLTDGHVANAGISPFIPYSKLAEIGGKVLCIGIGERIVAIRHEAQYLAGLLDIIPPRFGVKYIDDRGRIAIHIERATGGCTKRLPELLMVLRKMGVVRSGKIGMANSILLPAKIFLNVTAKLLRKDPTLNLCNSITCLWCRELERRMNLYNSIRNPKFYQKNRLVIEVIAAVNRFRLSNPIFTYTKNRILLNLARRNI